MRSKIMFLILAALGAGVLISLILPSWAIIAVLGCILLLLGLCGCKKF